MTPSSDARWFALPFASRQDWIVSLAAASTPGGGGGEKSASHGKDSGQKHRKSLHEPVFDDREQQNRKKR
jgi:hypothetical protein